MMPTTTESTVPLNETEAFATLVARIGRKATEIPAELLARHIMEIVPAGEWPVRAEAAEALLRRLDSGHKDELRIETRPEHGGLLGLYATRRRNSAARPYHTLVTGLDPIRGDCDCPDYLKNSLGLCKHILIVAERIHARPRALKQAMKEQQILDASPVSGFRWDPIRPLLGFGDWLERVSWRDGEISRNPGARIAEALVWFRAGQDGSRVVRKAYRNDSGRRLELVESLLKAVPSSPKTAGYAPALLALLTHEKAALKRVAEGTLGPAEQRAALKGLKCPLYPYQRDGVKGFLQAGRLLLADDMGLGKTAQAIACCDVLWRAGKVRKGIIIAPAALKPQWAREWDHFSNLPIRIIDGNPSERQAIYAANKEGFFIINYEQLLRDLEIVRGWNPDLVVLDEAQRIKNWSTKTALSVKGLNPPHRLVLTGTPMENRIEELASIVEWVDDMALEPKWRLPAFHAMRADGKREIVGVRNLDTIRERLRPCMVRRIRQEVLDQLPPRTDVRVPIEMTPAQMERHEELNQPIAQLVQISLKRPLTQVEFLRLMSLLTTQRIISNGLAQIDFEEVWPAIRACSPEESILRGLSAPKLLELRQLVRQLVIDQGRKVVIFSQWRRMLHLAHWAVGDMLTEQELRTGFFTGVERQKRRTQNIVEFHDDPAFRILFASDAGGVGLNLQRAANCVINLELPWNPAVLEQRIGRVYRLGQKLPIDVYNLVSEEGIEARIADLVGNKQAFFKGLFDGDSDSVRFDQAGSFLARVQKLYDPATLAAATAVGGTEEIELADLTDVGLDDEVEDPFEEIIEAADESRDIAEDAAESQAGPLTVPTTIPLAAPEARPAGPETTTAVRDRAALPGMAEVRQLFSQLQVRRGQGGGITIEAPAEAASTLGALFEGMAALLHAASQESD